MTERVEHIINNLDSSSVESVTQTLEAIKQVTDLLPQEKIDLTVALVEVFEKAHHTDSTKMPKLAMHAKKRIAKFGLEIIPFLFSEILEADSGTVAYFGQTIARLGTPALDYILARFGEYRKRDENLINLIQVVSYFKIPEATHVIPLLIKEAHHKNHQITSMAL
ncbi:MAG: hypothetical protein OEU76_07630, partial [Cyclobacteriaceae bacterium]|nr:hypothetical protein [Cyclobacteriaceae bacterium]